MMNIKNMGPPRMRLPHSCLKEKNLLQKGCMEWIGIINNQ